MSEAGYSWHSERERGGLRVREAERKRDRKREREKDGTFIQSFGKETLMERDISNI